MSLKNRFLTLSILILFCVALYLGGYLDTTAQIDADTWAHIKVNRSTNEVEFAQRRESNDLLRKGAGITALASLSFIIASAFFSLRKSNKRSFLNTTSSNTQNIASYPEADFETRLRLKFPTLSTTEIKLCLLLLENLSSKEIANKLNVNHSSVNTSRYRIRKKLMVPKQQDLTAFLKKI